MEIIKYILSLGGIIFVPVVMTIIGLVFRLGIKRALKSGVTVGIGLIGMGLVATLTENSLAPVIKIMVQRLNLNLTAIDVGGGPAAAVGFGSALGGILIPIILIVNILMLFFKFTKTMNVDIYNYWYFAITAGIVQITTGNILLAVLAAITHAVLGLKMADLTAKRLQKVVGLEEISIPHGFASASVPLFLVLEKIYSKIPYFKEEKKDMADINTKKIEFLGDPIFLGLILGLFFGVIAGYDLKNILMTVMNTAGIMVLFPRMVKLIVEGLIPISEAAKKYLNQKFSDRELYIGLDSAVTLGHPTTMTIGMLMIPFFLLFAAILPGNTTLPLGEVPFAPFYVCMATVVHNGNRLKTFISSLIFLPVVLYISSWAAPYFTQMAAAQGYTLVQDGQLAVTTALGNLFILIPALLAKIPGIGAVLLIFLCIAVTYLCLRSEKREEEREESKKNVKYAKENTN